MNSLIESKAKQLGFSLFGITNPSPLDKFPLFEDWISRNHYGEMQYLASTNSRDLRENPSLLFPDCRSIIVVGLPYGQENIRNTDLGRMALFAQQPDYHETIKTKLVILLKYIVSITDAKTKGLICCDTSPVLEKELGQRAGLGQIGRNSLLISPILGSLFNLGELFLNIELPYTKSSGSDPCTGCQLCVESCPTRCINNDRTLDAEQCISYLTIEHKGIIDREFASKNGFVDLRVRCMPADLSLESKTNSREEKRE